MARPTITDLAQAAGVSVATVNRVLAGSASVRQSTRESVQDAAVRIGFYGLGTIQGQVSAHRPRYRLGVLLLQAHRPFYRNVALAIATAAQAVSDADVGLQVRHQEDLSAQSTAASVLALGDECDAICVTSAVHPLLTQAVEAVQARGVPVFALISQISATGQVHYVGLDNWKIGRTAAWAMHNICRAHGKLGILIGNPRYRNQEMNEAGFRSYFREHAPAFTLLEPLPTFESAAVAEEITERLLRDTPDLAGLYIAGGGISGTLAALRRNIPAGRITVVGYELMDVTRAALLDGTMTLAISHPLDLVAKTLIDGMRRAVDARGKGGNFTAVLPFDIHTRENI